MADTPNLGLTIFGDGASGKKTAHNDSMIALEVAVQRHVLGIGENAPPSSPSEGDSYIIGSAPSNAWANNAGDITSYVNGAWAFVTPKTGWSVTQSIDGDAIKIYSLNHGGDWVLVSGDKGDTGKNNYELAQDAGFGGTYEEWAEAQKIKGDPGDKGDTGSQGPAGIGSLTPEQESLVNSALAISEDVTSLLPEFTGLWAGSPMCSSITVSSNGYVQGYTGLTGLIYPANSQISSLTTAVSEVELTFTGLWAGSSACLEVTADNHGNVISYTGLTGGLHRTIPELVSLTEAINELGDVTPKEPLRPSVSDGVLTAYGYGHSPGTLVCDLGDYTLSDVWNFSHLRVCGALVKSDYDANLTYVTGWPGGELLMPADRQTYRVWFGLGQSNDIGHLATPSLTATCPYPDTMLKLSGVDVRLGLDGVSTTEDVTSLIADCNSFDALIQQDRSTFGETFTSGMARTLAKIAHDNGAVPYRMVCAVIGVGGTSIDAMDKGTQTYSNILIAAQKIVDIAESEGARVVFEGYVARDGESDSLLSTYQTKQYNRWSDLNTDLKAISGQEANIRCVMVQPCYARLLNSYPHKAMAYLARTYPDNFICVGPAEPRFIQDDELHYTALGQARTGELIGHALKRALFRPVFNYRHNGTHISAVSGTGSTRDVTIIVSKGPLSVDTSTVSEMSGSKWGFRCTSPLGVDNPITGALLISDGGAGEYVTATVRLTMTSAPSSGDILSYGLAVQTSPTDPSLISRGNLRSASIGNSVYDGDPLYDWCVFDAFTL